MKGFFRRQARLANSFFVQWEKKIENRIAPPQLPGWNFDRLEELQIKEGGKIYSFNKTLSIMGYPHRGLSTLRATN
jgi:hypothetical protein